MRKIVALVSALSFLPFLSSCSHVGNLMTPFSEQRLLEDAPKGDASLAGNPVSDNAGKTSFYNSEKEAAKKNKPSKLSIFSENAQGLFARKEKPVYAAVPLQTYNATNKDVIKDNTYVYRLGAGDKIRLKVYDEEGLGGEFVVSSEGKVSLPLIGNLKASGLTVTELQASIINSLSNGYLKYPRVSVEILNFRPFYILGEVNKPGMYSYNSGLVIDSAVALGGGFTYRADNRKVYVKHENEDVEIEVPRGTAFQIQPGDTIRVAERYF